MYIALQVNFGLEHIVSCFNPGEEVKSFPLSYLAFFIALSYGPLLSELNRTYQR